MIQFGHPWGRQRNLNTRAMCATSMWKCTPFSTAPWCSHPRHTPKSSLRVRKPLATNQPINRATKGRRGILRPIAQHPPSRHLTKGVSATGSSYHQHPQTCVLQIVLWRSHLLNEPVLRPGGVNLQPQPPAPLPALVCYAIHLCRAQRVNRPGRCPLCRSLFPRDPPPGALAPACATQSP